MDKAQVIKQIAEYYNISRNIDFAEFFDVSPQVAMSWTKDGRYNIYEVYKRCPDINPEWLLSLGEKGEMVRKEEKDAESMTVAKALDNVDKALQRVADEQMISHRVLAQTDKILNLIGEAKEKKGE